MGNYISCTLSAAVVEAQSHGTKVILPGGDIRHLGITTATAAELMLDHPGYFLVHSSAMLTCRRLLALSADEELDLGAVYAMFPMDRRGSVATVDDMNRLLLSSRKADHRREPAPVEVAPENLEEVADVLIADLRFRRSLCRSRRPLLDTITEEAVY